MAKKKGHDLCLGGLKNLKYDKYLSRPYVGEQLQVSFFEIYFFFFFLFLIFQCLCLCSNKNTFVRLQIVSFLRKFFHLF